MGIFGRVPSGGGPGTSRQDRRRAGARGKSRVAKKRDNQRRAQFLIVGGVVIAALAVLGIGIFGYLQTSYRPQQQTVLKVGDRTYDMSYVEKRLTYVIKNAAPGTLIMANYDQALLQTFNDLESDEINRIGAPQVGVSVSDDEVDAKIRQNLGLSDSVDQATYADAYRNLVKASGFSPDEYRELIAAQLLEDKIRQNLRASIPDSTEQVHVSDIEVATQQDAQTVQDRLAKGEDFAAVANDTTISTDTSSNTKGGDLGWVPRGAYPTDIENAIFALSVGQTTQPLSYQNSFYIYKVTEKSPSMTLTDTERTNVENESYANWQQQVANQISIDRVYLSDKTMITHLEGIAKSLGSGVANTGEQP
ncbi:MAG: peptidylprolyl isomerase [Dehalococcoidia bacterium]|jgi:parvulin-like peptidyl-prolyl isomerase